MHRSTPLLFACLLPLAAHADRPLVSETADVIDEGACQLEMAGARTKQKDSPSERGLAALASCGVAGIHQFGIGISRDRVADESATGLVLTGKTTLHFPGEGRPGFGVAYSLGFDKSAGNSLRHESATVLAAVTQQFGEGLIAHANLGWDYSKSARMSTTTWALGIETTGDFWVAADIFGDDRSRRPWASAGFGWAPVDGFSLNFAYAQQFERPRIRQLSVGLKIEF